MSRLLLFVLCAIYCLTSSLAFGEEKSRAEKSQAVLPCTCPFWIIGHIGGGAHMYYATFYDEGTNCSNGEVVYYIGDEVIPQTCEDCVPEKVGAKTSEGINHHTRMEFPGLDPKDPSYTILDDIRPRVVREHTYLIRRQPCFYEFQLGDEAFRIRAYRFVLAVDPKGLDSDAPPAFMNIGTEVTEFDDNDTIAPIRIKGTVKKLRGRYAFQVKHKLGEQKETDLLLLDKND